MNELTEKQARRRVAELKGFYSHLASYVVVNFILIAVNLITSPDTLWFFWVTIFWGLGLAFHALDVFALRGRFLGKDWQERKVHEMLERDKRKSA